VVAGRWTLTRLLGIGGMASVYEAHHRNGRKAALKVLHPFVTAQPLARRRFLAEGYAANKVQHRGVVLILDDGEDGDLLFLVMELLTGRSLAERLAQQGPLPPSEVVRISAAVLDVLAAAHDAAVVHRDIKPSNLFELESGEIKVLDFGVARVRDPGSTAVTESGVTLGTPAFMAPEQAAGKLDEIDALTDIWAVGATMFQLLTARLVHEAATPNAAIVAAATQAVASVRAVRPELPGDVVAVVDRALAFRREDRFPNARAMQRALLGSTPAAASASTAVSPPTLPELDRAGRPPRSPRAFWIVVAAVVLSAGIGAAWLGVERARNPSPASAASAPQPPIAATLARAELAPASPGPSAAAPGPSSKAKTAVVPSTSAGLRPNKNPTPGARWKPLPRRDAEEHLIDTRQ